MTLLNRSLNRITWVLWITWVGTMWAQKSCGGSPLQTQPLNKLIFWTSCLAISDIELVVLLNFIKSACMGLVLHFPVLEKGFWAEGFCFSAQSTSLYPYVPKSPYSDRVWISYVSSFDARLTRKPWELKTYLWVEQVRVSFMRKHHRCGSSRSKTDMAFNIVGLITSKNLSWCVLVHFPPFPLLSATLSVSHSAKHNTHSHAFKQFYFP